MIWRLLHDRLPTKINLYKRQVQLQDDTTIKCRFYIVKLTSVFDKIDVNKNAVA